MLLNNNEDSPFAYNYITMRTSGSAATSSSTTSAGKFQVDVAGITNTQRIVSTIQLFDYAQTDKHKSLLWRFDNANSEAVATAGRWAQTTAVSSIQLRAGSSTWAAGSSFALYGVSS
jgi:hypothetical protein